MLIYLLDNEGRELCKPVPSWAVARRLVNVYPVRFVVFRSESGRIFEMLMI